MLFVHRAPAPPLDAFIASLWYSESGPRPFTLERVLPSGCAQLIVNLKEDQTRAYHAESLAVTVSCGTILSGVTSCYRVIDTAEQESAAGVSFRPGGTAPFFRTPAHEICNRDVPLECGWGRGRAADLRERLLAAPTAAAKLDVLERTMAQAWDFHAPDRVVAFALAQFAAMPQTTRIAEVTGLIGLSPKRFIERFRSAVGVAPKQFCRIVRFQRALAQAELGRRIDWTGIALDSGYFDQAHFIHDFRAFSGITPTGYEAGRTQFRNHVNFLQSETASPVR